MNTELTPERLAELRDRQTSMEDIVAKVRQEWPEVSGYRVPEVRDGGMTATLIDHAVLTAVQAENARLPELFAHIDALTAEVERSRFQLVNWKRMHDIAEQDAANRKAERDALAAEVGTLTRERDEWEANEQALAAKLDAVRQVAADLMGEAIDLPFPSPARKAKYEASVRVCAALDGDAS